uniref:glutathione synthase n=1 Tax=Sedimenticola sp. TaxID=1940285 RepID=UPI003D0CCE1A
MHLGVVMDPIGSINFKKDSTLAMLLAASRKGWSLSYMEPRDLYLSGQVPHASMRSLVVHDNPQHWFDLEDPSHRPLTDLDCVLMRRDPPMDMEYIYSTQLLELAETRGVLVVNKPQSLRDANEKLFTAHFPQCCPPSVVSSNHSVLKAFLEEHRDAVIKPLGSMGGDSIFRLHDGDPNTSVILETLTARGTRLAMLQRFLPQIEAGDKRILLIDGEPVPYALARIPAPGEFRGNLAAGGRGEGVPLSDRDRWICEQVAPKLREMGLIFVGLDVIGDYLTEINVTSPTCIRELDRLYDLDIGM